MGVLLTIGLALAGLALFQARPLRTRAAIAATALALAGITGLAVTHAIAHAEYARNQQAEGDAIRARLLPGTPKQALEQLMILTARGDTIACWNFNDNGKKAFTNTYQAPDCPTAIGTAHSHITDRAAYEDKIDIDTITVRPTLHGMEVNGCAVEWPHSKLDKLLNGRKAIQLHPGPTPGILTVVPSGYGVGWISSDFRPC